MKTFSGLIKTLKWIGVLAAVVSVLLWSCTINYDLSWKGSTGYYVGTAKGTFSIGHSSTPPSATSDVGWRYATSYERRRVWPLISLESDEWSISLPLWISVSSGLLVAFISWARERAVARIKSGACMKCGSQRMGMAYASACSKCKAIPEKYEVKVRKRRTRLWRSLKWICAALVILSMSAWTVSGWYFAGWWSESSSGPAVCIDRGLFCVARGGMRYRFSEVQAYLLEGFMFARHSFKPTWKSDTRVRSKSYEDFSSVPLWAIAIFFSGAGGLCWLNGLALPPRSRCFQCNYDLSGIDKDGCCPECGRAVYDGDILKPVPTG